MSKLSIASGSKRSSPRQSKQPPPTYHAIRTLTGWWVGRSVNDVFTLIEKFPDEESALDFIGYCTQVVEAARYRLATH